MTGPAPAEPVKSTGPTATASPSAAADPYASAEPTAAADPSTETEPTEPHEPAGPTEPTPSATANLTRVLCIAVAAAGVIFGALSLGSFLAQGWHPNPPLAAAAWLSAFGLPVVLWLCCRWAPLRVLRSIVALQAVCYVVVCLFWLMAGPGPLPDGAEIPWVITYTGVPCVAVAAFAGRKTAWAFTVLATGLSGVVRFDTTTEQLPVFVGLADGLYSLLLVSTFVALTLAARRAAARVDDATLLTRQAEARRAARVSRRRERLRIDALVHDSVISTLLMAGLGRSPLPVVSEHAAKTLRQLDALREPPVQPVVLVSDVLRRLTRLAAQIAPDAPVRLDAPSRPGDRSAVERTVPAVAVAAMLGATGEALRNSMKAAAGSTSQYGMPSPTSTSPSGKASTTRLTGPTNTTGPTTPVRRVRRTVTLLSTTDGCQITVSDDGVGFDPATVPPERLGIAQSILGRMQQVPGGAANLRSAPGHGTDVVITWAPDRFTLPAASEAAALGAATRRAPAPAVPTVELPTSGRVAHVQQGNSSATGQLADATTSASTPAPATSAPATSAPATSAPATSAPAASAPATFIDRRSTTRRVVDAALDPTDPPTLAQSLGLSALTTRSILALFVLVHGLLAVIDLEPNRPTQLVLGAFLAIIVAAWVALVTDFDQPFPRPRAALVLGLCAVGAILMFAYLPPDSTAPFAHWHLGAITLILVVLGIRGQIGWAWLGYLGLGALAVGWAMATAQSPLAAINLISRHAGTLLAGTLFVVGLHRTERTLWVLTANDIARASRDATTVAAIDEREAELMRVNALARPTLHRLAEPRPLTDAERAQCLLIEAGLRDAIRGRALFLEPVITAVATARQRGVEVTVLDDSGDNPPDALPALAQTVADVLDTVDVGRVTIRVLPAGRPDVATLVIDSATPRLLAVGPTGALTTP